MNQNKGHKPQMDRDMSLQATFDALVELDIIRPSRIAPIRTALRQYAQILGYNEAARCPANDYLKADGIRNRLIDKNAPQTLGSDGLRNLKNNVSYVVRKAIEYRIISPLANELASWKESNNGSEKPKRNENVLPDKYVIDPVPQPLNHEIAEYENWSTRIYNRARPKRLRKRTLSFSHHRRAILCAAGYLVKFKGLKPESVSLRTLIEPANAIDYVEWYITQQGRFTAGAASQLGRMIAIAKYVEIISQSSKQKSLVQRRIRELTEFRANLGTPVTVRDKDKRWLTLNQLEMVGRSIYPLNARRVKEVSKATRTEIERHHNKEHRSRPWTFQRYAFQVLMSLLIRLIIRIPFRQRNLREMLWNPRSPEDGQNLYRKHGVWRLRFRGNELKISELKGDVHSLEYEFPGDLVDLLEEWLDKWRPILVAGQTGTDLGKERFVDDQQFVFLNYRGCPLGMKQVTEAFERTTFRFTGVSLNPHMVRTIYATEYIKATNNFFDAAYMLGDTVETVLRSYAKLLDEDCAKRASSWITHRLQAETSGANDEEGQSSLPPVKYSRGG
jgi:hypothetical protein